MVIINISHSYSILKKHLSVEFWKNKYNQPYMHISHFTFKKSIFSYMHVLYFSSERASFLSSSPPPILLVMHNHISSVTNNLHLLHRIWQVTYCIHYSFDIRYPLLTLAPFRPVIDQLIQSWQVQLVITLLTARLLHTKA